jgi:hypothetical protein
MNPLKQYSESLPERIKQTGSSLPEADEISLKAGNLLMKFSNGALRDISSGHTELIRMIYAAVRDREWLTIEPAISYEQIDIKPDSFVLKFTCRYISGENDFIAWFEITGESDSSIYFSMEGRAKKTFQRNRIGFCVLHPIETCAGKPCILTHPDGTVEESLFPQLVQPDQPFLNVRSMRWPASGGMCRLDFEGDIFETEDQRNWTDASFKTYSTPLSMKYPVTVQKGTTVTQRIVFTTENLKADIIPENEPVHVVLDPRISFKIPMIGIARTTRSEPLTQTELRILRPLRFDHYRINVRLFENGWKSDVSMAVDEAADLASKIEFALFVDDNFEIQIRDFIKWFNSLKPKTYCFLIFHKSCAVTPTDVVKKVLNALRDQEPRIRIGIGTNANFAELNRNRPEGHNTDLICFSIQPQEHASDNQTLTENLAGQEYVVRSAARFAENTGIWVSPVNIRRRFNANVSFMEEPFTGIGLPPQADARIMSLYGACWTAISLKFLCSSGIAGVTYYETVGEKGIIQGKYNSRWPEEFPSGRGMIFPVYFIFKYLQKYRSFRVIRSSSSQPALVDSFALSDGKQLRMILINFTKHTKTVRMTGCTGIIRLRELNTVSFSEAVSNHNWKGENMEKVIRSGEPLIAEPYSISFIEGWLKKINNTK